MLARCDLLHHEQSQTYKAETIAEVFEHDAAANQYAVFRLEGCQQGIDNERKVEDATQGEQCFLQSA